MYEATVGKHNLKTNITVENKGNLSFVKNVRALDCAKPGYIGMIRNLLPGYSIRQGYISL